MCSRGSPATNTMHLAVHHHQLREHLQQQLPLGRLALRAAQGLLGLAVRGLVPVLTVTT